MRIFCECIIFSFFGKMLYFELAFKMVSLTCAIAHCHFINTLIFSKYYKFTECIKYKFHGTKLHTSTFIFIKCANNLHDANQQHGKTSTCRHKTLRQDPREIHCYFYNCCCNGFYVSTAFYYTGQYFFDCIIRIEKSIA